MKKVKLIDDPSEYGSKKSPWAPEFVEYMKTIITHPVYKDMPDAIKEDGKMQWEAPSNRKSGKYRFTHNKRRIWWEQKAKAIGVDTTKDQWISRTAKLIHPTKEKVCKKCGNSMRIEYVYPQKRLINKFNKIFNNTFDLSLDDTIFNLLVYAHDLSEDTLFQNLPVLLQTKGCDIPEFNNDFDLLLIWLEDEFIPKEPSILSPGVMSNAPDRLDGFHSFNLCCRGKADKGRHKDNLSKYGSDRRVFEYWSEGDWTAADRLMGLVRTELKNEATEDGGDGAPSADHIGPLSLGFCHMPEFKLLSSSANSSKGNRMTLSDVKYLVNREQESDKIISWYALSLWDNKKNDVDNEEKALRLSKLLRDNQRNFMFYLHQIFNRKKYSFLIYLMELEYANWNIEFKDLKVVDFVTEYTEIIKTERNTKYTNEQKARRIRVGLNDLRAYTEKDNRHNFIINDESIDSHIKEISLKLENIPKKYQIMDENLEKILFPDTGMIHEEKLREFAANYPQGKIQEFEDIKKEFIKIMEIVSGKLSDMWKDPRYVREEFEF